MVSIKERPVISVTDSLPPFDQYVLIHVNKNNWGDDEDVYWRVARRVPANCYGNNRRFYEWDEHGPSKRFGQEVDFWMPLPKMPPVKKIDYRDVNVDYSELLEIIRREIDSVILKKTLDNLQS